MKNRLYLALIILFGITVLSMNAYSYIDPGTGGIVIGSSIGPIIAAIIGFISTFFIKPIRNFMKRFWKIILIIIFIIIIIYITYLDKSNDIMNNEKVLLIGIDGTPPRIMEELMAKGLLPNFAKLKETGDYSILKTSIPPESPVAWSSIATGNNPGKFGLFDFIGHNKENIPELSILKQKTPHSLDYTIPIKGETFWEITSKNNIPTTIIRWPVTFPTYKVNGRMLAGLGFPDIYGFLNSYSFYTSEDSDKNDEGTGRIIKVDNENIIKTKIIGPLTNNGNVEVPIEIKKNDKGIILIVENSEYNIKENEWSDWIRIKFNLGLFNNVHGIAKAYLISSNPFRMYLTSIQIDPENPLLDLTYPKDYSKELANNIGLYYTMGMPEDTKAVNEKKITTEVFYEQIKQIEEERRRMFWYEFNRFDNGLFAFAFDSSDRLMHIFWNKDKIDSHIIEYYQNMDKFLGEVLEKTDDNTKIIIFSDHGFNTFKRAVSINKWLIDNNFMEINDNGQRELFNSVDWKNTQAYSLGFASIYINLENKEKGRVKKEDREKIVDEIINKLKELKDPETNENVITNLYKKEDVYDGKYLEEAPDIIIGFNEGYRMAWQDAIGGYKDEIITENNEDWKGDHLMDRSHVPGILFTNFKINKKDPELTDIAPTVLGFFDIKEEMDGESLIK